MTVHELIGILSAMPPDARVVLEVEDDEDLESVVLSSDEGGDQIVELRNMGPL